jgi:hypothetical protein
MPPTFTTASHCPRCRIEYAAAAIGRPCGYCATGRYAAEVFIVAGAAKRNVEDMTEVNRLLQEILDQPKVG